MPTFVNEAVDFPGAAGVVVVEGGLEGLAVAVGAVVWREEEEEEPLAFVRFELIFLTALKRRGFGIDDGVSVFRTAELVSVFLVDRKLLIFAADGIRRKKAC